MRRWLAALCVAFSLVCALPPGTAHAADTRAAVRKALARAQVRSAIVLDPQAGTVLGSKAADRHLPPASLLKMATALVVAARLSPEDTLVISERAARAAHDQVGWRAGARFTVDEVMHGMIMMSSNGAAIALAERVSGSVEAFRSEANELLRLIGAPNTRLVDPSGLDAPGQYSTARDLAHMAAAFLDYPWLADIALDRDYRLPWPGEEEAAFGNINRYLSHDPSAIGVKNGYTSAAGNCVAAASSRRGRTLIVVALDGPNVYADAREIMDAAFGFEPEPRPQRVEVTDVTDVAEQTEDLAPPPAAAAVQEQVAAQPVESGRKGGRGTYILIGLVTAYVARVRQVRRRRARRRAARRRIAALREAAMREEEMRAAERRAARAAFFDPEEDASLRRARPQRAVGDGDVGRRAWRNEA